MAKEDRGLIPRALEHLFVIAARDTAHTYDISVSYVQIYCELVHDLLVAEPAEKNLLLREDSEGAVYVEGVTRVRVHDAAHCLQLLAQGHRNRATARTRYVTGKEERVWAVGAGSGCGEWRSSGLCACGESHPAAHLFEW